MELNKNILDEVGKQFLVVSFPYLDYLDFRKELKMKINDLIEIENIDTLC